MRDSVVWGGGEIGKGWDCNTWPWRPHSKHVLEHPFTQPISNKLFHSKQQKNAIVLRPLRAVASHELLHELLRRQTTIAATPLAESTPSPNSQVTAGLSKYAIISAVVQESRKRSLAKGVWQKSDERSHRSLRKSDQKWKKGSNSFCRPPFAAPWLTVNYLNIWQFSPSKTARVGGSGCASKVAIAIPIYRSLHTPEPRNPEKVSKRCPGRPGPECQKACRKSPRTLIL